MQQLRYIRAKRKLALNICKCFCEISRKRNANVLTGMVLYIFPLIMEKLRPMKTKRKR